ncbi:hypothetical protein [Halosimplex pelagicum]|uniref:Uncharacterized protein n=1 Tax=Halosimplex pelagicum TaxID=869886 RepID=A0A7D5SWJ2_9EURY|nr:hypothetical protein [Halosimplex pelagicum]QLH83207.1 hypothetical protein HZS54_16920 [Halosimplex pelagicum]
MSDDSPSTSLKPACWFLAGVLFGMVIQTWRMVRIPIDEYHAARMDIEERLAEMEEVLDDER